MRSAYVDAHVDLPESFRLAWSWAGRDARVTVVGPSTSAIEASPFLERSGLRLGVTGHRHTRFDARPSSGTVVAWCLRPKEVLALGGEGRFDGFVVVRTTRSHAPWVTARGAQPLGEHPLTAVPEATQAVKSMVETITMLAVLNQGLVDSRERSTAVQALTYLYQRGHRLDPEQLMVEAMRAGWPGESPYELAQLAIQINAGKRLRFENRLNPAAMASWERA